MIATVSLGGGAAVSRPRVARAVTPFTTSERPYLVALTGGVQIHPIISSGDIIGGARAGYQMSGVPDGIGAYRTTDGSIEVFFNHELSPRYDPSGARVSHVTLNDDGAVVAASYPWTDRGIRVVLLEHARDDPRRPLVPHRRGGQAQRSSRQLDRAERHLRPLRRDSAVRSLRPRERGAGEGTVQGILGLSEDGFGELSQHYAYIADTFGGAISGSEGALRVWVPDEPVADGNPSSNDIAKGETMAGHFERIPHGDTVMPRDSGGHGAGHGRVRLQPHRGPGRRPR